MKNPIDISKKAYDRILKVDQLIDKLDATNTRLNDIISTQNQLNQRLETLETENNNLNRLLIIFYYRRIE